MVSEEVSGMAPWSHQVPTPSSAFGPCVPPSPLARFSLKLGAFLIFHGSGGRSQTHTQVSVTKDILEQGVP